MIKYFVTLGLVFIISINSSFAQPKAKNKKKTTIGNTANKPNNKEAGLNEFIRTNNSDTLYLDLDNSVILTPIGKYKNIPYELKTSVGDIMKMGNNFFLVSNLKAPEVTITVIDEKTKAVVAEKKFKVAVQKLPF